MGCEYENGGEGGDESLSRDQGKHHVSGPPTREARRHGHKIRPTVYLIAVSRNGVGIVNPTDAAGHGWAVNCPCPPLRVEVVTITLMAEIIPISNLRFQDERQPIRWGCLSQYTTGNRRFLKHPTYKSVFGLSNSKD